MPHRCSDEQEAALETLRQTQHQVVEAEKMASLGLLTAGVAHEINNPINFLVTGIPSVRRDVDELVALVEETAGVGDSEDLPILRDEIHLLLQGTEEGARRTAEIVQGLRSFSRMDEGEIKPASLREGLESTLLLLRKQYEPRIVVETHYADVHAVECFPGQLNQVFMNILVNAVQAIPDTGRIRVDLTQEGPHVTVRIRDTGAGMSEDVRAHIFEPFYTTKSVGEGTGLGLSISYGIIERLHGTMTVESVPGEGSAFTITVPVHQPQRPDPPLNAGGRPPA